MCYTQHLSEYSGPLWWLVYYHFTDGERQTREGCEEPRDLDSDTELKIHRTRTWSQVSVPQGQYLPPDFSWEAYRTRMNQFSKLYFE